MRAKVYSILAGANVPATTKPRPAPQAAPAAGPAEQLLGKVVNWNLSKMLDEAGVKERAAVHQAEEERSAKTKLEAQHLEEKTARERLAADQQAAVERAQASLLNANTVAEHLRAELIEKETAVSRIREASDRAAEEHRVALAAAQAAAEAAAQARPPQIITQAPMKPETIDFKYRWAANGLLDRVTLKAAGYDDVAIDIVRGADNRMRSLRLG